jgi:NAD(P)-dependent dehydrogenase (short-subunit alcohol dehydrogenase family)
MITILVTGCDSGIGRAIALQLAGRGDRVIGVCLNDSSDLHEHGVEVELRIDVTSDEAVGALAARLRERQVQLDWLLSVAGVLAVDQLGSIDLAEVKRQLEVNAIGPLRLVQALLDRLRSGSKVGIVSSRVGSLSDNASGGLYGYRMSKAAVNMAGLNLHHDLSKRGIPVVLLHPGQVRTAMTKNFFNSTDYVTAEFAANGIIRNMDELTLSTSGRFLRTNGEEITW